MSSIPGNVYPLSTAEGLSIPLAVASPKGGIRATVGSSSIVTIALPEDTNVCTVYLDQNVELWITTPGAIVDNTYAPGCMLLLGKVAYDLVLPRNISLKGLAKPAAGVINVLETWVQMQNTGNYGVS